MKPIVIEDLMNFVFPSNPQYSPDGRKIAFETAQADQNTYFHSVWTVQGGTVKRMTYNDDTQLIGWEDDHTLLLKRSCKDHKPGTMDVYRLDLNGAEAQYVRTYPVMLSGFVKAGKYTAALGGIDRRDADAYLDDEHAAAEKARKKEEEKDYEVLDELPYWFNGRNFTNGKRSSLFLLNGTEIRRITSPEQNVACMTVNGDIIYYAAETWKAASLQTQQLYAYDTVKDTAVCIYPEKDLTFSSPFVRNANVYFFATDHKKYGTNQTPDLYVVHEQGIEKVYTSDLSLRNTVGSDVNLGSGKGYVTDGESFYTLVTDDDHTAIRCYDAVFGHRTVYDEQGSITCLDAKDGKVCFMHSDWNHLFELYEMQADGSVRCLTSLNADVLADKYIAEPVRLDYVSQGLSLHGWVLAPEDYDSEKKYPAVLDIHGGPRCTFGNNFFHEMQVWASKGYFVFFTNIKGSDGRGDEFADLRDQYGGVDYDNLMDFTDAVLKAYPAIDAGKLCVTGGSYGGFMTNWIIGHTDRFCCAASQRSIANWISKCLVSDIGYYFNVEQQGAEDLFTGTESLWRHSPLKYAGNCVTPTLFIHSDEDRRCPLPEGLQMMQALMIKGVETRMCLFHGENHELSRSGKPKHRIRRLQEMTNWFDHYTE